MGNSGNGMGDFATLRPTWRALWPWLLLSLLLHAGLLGPEPPLPAPAPTPTALQWRMLPAPAPPQLQPAPAAPTARAATQGGAPRKPTAEASRRPLSLPASGRWHYQLRSRGEVGEAEIDWQQDGSRYRLLLRRRTPTRELPSWVSEGRLSSDGLQPLQFSTQRGRRTQTLLQFDPKAGRLTGPRGQQQPVPVLTQDRLSWMWQLAALAAARPPRPGQPLRLEVASWQGELQHWQLVVDHDPEAPQLLRLRRLPPEGSLLSQLIWLDPARGHLPVRLQLRYDEAERWEIELIPGSTTP